MSGEDVKMREVLERLWQYNAPRADRLDYELVVLAVPRFPANIEAIASVDTDTLCELLQAYIDARKTTNELRRQDNALPPIGAEGGAADQDNGRAIHANEAADGGPGQRPLGQGVVGGGAPEEHPDQAPAQGGGDAAEDAVGLNPVEAINATLDNIQREKRIAASRATGKPCVPAYPGTASNQCMRCEDTCTGMHPRVDVG